jgi:hypothetical protein
MIAIQQLNSSPHEFHVCGSRFFGDAKDHSDFDFFILHSPNVVEWLSSNGWVYGGSRYRDINSVEILNKGKATVITVHSVEDRKKIQKHLMENGIHRIKGDVGFWNDLYRTVCGVG